MQAFQYGTISCCANSALRKLSYTPISAASEYCALTPHA